LLEGNKYGITVLYIPEVINNKYRRKRPNIVFKFEISD